MLRLKWTTADRISNGTKRTLLKNSSKQLDDNYFVLFGRVRTKKSLFIRKINQNLELEMLEIKAEVDKDTILNKIEEVAKLAVKINAA